MNIAADDFGRYRPRIAETVDEAHARLELLFTNVRQELDTKCPGLLDELLAKCEPDWTGRTSPVMWRADFLAPSLGLLHSGLVGKAAWDLNIPTPFQTPWGDYEWGLSRPTYHPATTWPWKLRFSNLIRHYNVRACLVLANQVNAISKSPRKRTLVNIARAMLADLARREQLRANGYQLRKGPAKIVSSVG